MKLKFHLSVCHIIISVMSASHEENSLEMKAAPFKSQHIFFKHTHGTIFINMSAQKAHV